MRARAQALSLSIPPPPSPPPRERGALLGSLAYTTGSSRSAGHVVMDYNWLSDFFSRIDEGSSPQARQSRLSGQPFEPEVHTSQGAAGGKEH